MTTMTENALLDDQHFTKDELILYYDLAQLYCSPYLHNFIERYNKHFPKSRYIDDGKLTKNYVGDAHEIFAERFKNLSILKDSEVWFQGLFMQNISYDSKEIKKFLKTVNKNHTVDVFSVTEKHLQLTYYYDAVVKNERPIHIDVLFQFCKKYCYYTKKEPDIKKVLELMKRVEIDERFLPYLEKLHSIHKSVVIKNTIEEIILNSSDAIKEKTDIVIKKEHNIFSSEIMPIFRTQLAIDSQLLIKISKLPMNKLEHATNLLIHGIEQYIVEQYYIESTVSNSSSIKKIVYESSNKEKIEKIHQLFDIIKNNFLVITEYIPVICNSDKSISVKSLIEKIVLKENLEQEFTQHNNATKGKNKL